MTMQKIRISFRCLNESLSFEISSSNEQTLGNFIFTFFQLFPGVDFSTQTINSLHQNTADLKLSITDFVDTYKSVTPALNRVAAFFNRMTENEWFHFIPFKTISTIEDISLVNYLIALSNPGKEFDTLQNQFKDLFGDLLSDYEISVFGPDRKNIGEIQKSKRICRFCENSRTPISFNNKAHAISEALGNKTVVLYEECDNCNSYFSQSIEQDLIEYLSLFRTFYQIKGKGGAKDFVGKNFELRKADNLVLKFESDGEQAEGDLPMSIPLHSNKKISRQNIYRTLCKYFISVIPSEKVPDFKNTIKWINGKLEQEQLPKIAFKMFHDKLAEQPQLTVYLRSSEDYSIPYAVGELHFALLRYVFIVPCSERDQEAFVLDNEHKRFWSKFKHFSSIPEWSFEDFSDNVQKPFTINFKIVQNQSPEI